MFFGLFLFSINSAAGGFGKWTSIIAGLSVPVMVVGFVSLIIVIMKLVKMFGNAEIFRAPIRDKSEVKIPAAGKFNICLEVPVLTASAGSGLSYKLLNQENGREIRMYATIASLMRRNSGATTTFIEREFKIAEAGKYTLEVSGLSPQNNYSKCQLIVARPTALKTLFFILGIILTGMMFIAGLVFTLIVVSANR